MTVLLDESLPEQLARELPGHEVETVRSMSWLGVQNGSLLRLVAQFFEVLVTADKNMMYQQSLKAIPFAMIVLSTNHLPTLRMHLVTIREAVDETPAGQIRQIECGKFMSRKQRRRLEQSGG